MSKAVLTKYSEAKSYSSPAYGILPPLHWRSGLRLINQPGRLGNRLTSKIDDPSEKFLRDVVGACVSNVAVLNESGIVLYGSKAWRIFAQSAVDTGEQITALFHFQVFRNRDNAAFDDSEAGTLSDHVYRLIAGEQKELHGDYFYQAISGPRSVSVTATRLNLPGADLRILITLDDSLSPREALRKSEERLSHLLDTTRIVAWEAEPETWKFTHVSEQALKILGYPIANWYEPDFFLSKIHPSDRKRVLVFCLKQLRAVDNFDLTFRMTARNGNLVWIHNLVSVTREDGRPVAARGFMIDITERERAQEALRDLGGRLIAAQEEERSRVARELHDDLNQRMALLSIGLEQLKPEIEKPMALRPRVRKLQQQVQEISADIHRLSYRLHPSKLDHLGLAAAVQSLCKEMSEGQKLKIEFCQEGFPVDLSKDVTLCVFRIAQEALRNCMKYSVASIAKVMLKNTGQVIHLSVSDDGCGFDIGSDVMQKGLGFTSMRERLRIVDGVIEIRSRPALGTVIEVSVPFARNLDHQRLGEEDRNALLMKSF